VKSNDSTLKHSLELILNLTIASATALNI
jgi:hypothetical protein